MIYMKNSLFFLLTFMLSHLPAQEMFIAVLSKGAAGNTQYYTIKDQYPIEKAQEYQDLGFFIDDISYGGEKWTIVASDKKWVSDQKVIVSEQFPGGEIDEMAQNGYFISSLTYGKDKGVRKWGAVFAKGMPIEEQIIVEGDEFPHEEVQEKLIEGYRITEVCVGNETHKVVMVRTDALNLVSQDYMVTEVTEVLNTYLKAKTDGEYPSYITHLSYQNNQWFAVTTFGTDFNSQYFTMQKAVPENTIKGSWEDGYAVSAFQKININKESTTGYIPQYLIDAEYLEKGGIVGCPEALTPKAYNKIAGEFASTTIIGVEGDNIKLEIIRNKLATQNACFSVDQIARLLNTIQYDEARFSLVEMVYHHVYDIDNIPALVEAFEGNEELLDKFKRLTKQ